MPEHSDAIVGAMTRVGALGLNAGFMFPLTVCLVLGGCARAPAPREDADSASLLDEVRIEREDHQWAVPADRRCVVIENPFGDLHLRAGRAGSIAYHAVMQRIEAALPRPAVVMGEAHRCASIRVQIDGQHPDSRRRWNVRWARVDLAVAVPPGVAVEARSDVGSIDAKKLDNAIRAFTVNGNIQLSGSGDVVAQSMSGSIALTARGQRPDRRWQATTESGVIRAFVEAQVASLAASTCGDVSTTFATAVNGTTPDGCSIVLVGRSEAADVMLRSEHGDIEIYRLEP